MSPLIYDNMDAPVLLRPGGNDLRYSSIPLSQWDGSGRRTVELVGDGRQVSYARLFGTQVWVAAVVMRLLSWSVRVPLKVYRRTGEDSRERLRSGDHPLAAALVDPWERGSQADLTQALLGPVLVHGNSLVEIDEGQSGRIQFRPVDWRNATPLQPFEWTISGWKLLEDNAARTITADNTMHIAWWSPLGPTGVSPLAQLGTTISIEDAAQRYQQAMFRNGARPPSAITADKEFLGLGDTERQLLLQQLRDDVNETYTGPEQAGKPALLPPGLRWEQVGHTAVEAELIDQRRVTREEIAAVYQMPPPLVGIYDRATFSNIETAREIGYTDSLAPPLVLIEQKINAHIVRHLLREDDVFVEFDFAGVLRGDRLKEVQALREAIGTGLMTPNEGRRTLNFPSSEQDGMDSLYLPGNNMRPIGAQDRDLGDLTLSAQRLGLAIRNGVISQEEARALIGIEGPPPEMPGGDAAVPPPD